MRIILALIVVLSVFVFQSDIFAQIPTPTGTDYLDTTFNQNGAIKGRATMTFGFGSVPAKVAVTDNMGRITVAACSSFYVYAGRLLPSGVIDSTFGVNGKVSISAPDYYVDIKSMVRLSDGKFLMAGSVYSGNAKNMLVIKLRQNGMPDSSWNADGVIHFDLGSNAEDLVNDMAINSDGSIILVGKSGINGACVRLRSDGTFDPTFGGGDGIVTWSTNGLKDEASSLTLDGDTIYIAGHYEFASATANSSYTVLKLAPDGTQTGFGKVNFPAAGLRYTTSILLQPDGKIVVGGYTGPDFLIYRLLANGNFDPAFNYTATGRSQFLMGTVGGVAYLTRVMYDNKDKKYVLTGHANVGSYNSFAIARLISSGAPDNSFANSGKLLINPLGNSSCSAVSSLISSDKKLLIIGSETGTTSVLKVTTKPIVQIVGKDYVLPNSTEAYEVNVPASWPYSYRWSFTGSDYYFVPDSIGSKVLLFFNEGATDGVLTSYAYIGTTVYATVELAIKINNNPSAANLLTEVQCDKKITDCFDNYISNFKLNLINNDSSTCNSTGYSDFTRSQWVDTLIAGSVYSASVRAESDESIKYAAMWIDYNNDGVFDSTSEFVTQVYGPGPILNLQNIILKNKEGYSGPKRLRVRCSPVGFTSGQACAESGELGETEDYMIIINEQDKLEAPEIITPNEDGKNDYFVIRGVDPAFDNTLSIFDRYGEVIYSTSNYENNWDGKSKDGGKVNPGTYYYYFKNNETFIRGFVEIRY